MPSGADDDVVAAVRRAGERDGAALRRAVRVGAGVPPRHPARVPGAADVVRRPVRPGLRGPHRGAGRPAPDRAGRGRARHPRPLRARTRRDLDAAAELVRRQRPLVREYWSDPADLAALFADGRIVLGQARGKVAATWPPSACPRRFRTARRSAGPSWFVIAAVPRIPAARPSGATTRSAPSVQIALARAAGGAPAVRAACAIEGPAACAADRLDDQAFLSSLRVARTPLEPTGIARVGAGVERCAALGSRTLAAEERRVGRRQHRVVAGADGSGGTPGCIGRWLTGTLVVCALALTAAACGDAGDPAPPATVAASRRVRPARPEPPVLGGSMPTSIGAGEGRLNLVVRPGYAEDGSTDPNDNWVKAFQDETGCTVTSRVAATSDEMVQLMHTGQYDGVSAWGDASTRLVLAARRRPGERRPDPQLPRPVRLPQGPARQHLPGDALRHPARPGARTC